jgi:putative ABC transport system permease protein
VLKNYIKIAFRNIAKHKLFSLITVVGLAVGMSSCLLIMLYVEQEISYDSFLPNAENIYRVGHSVNRPARTDVSAASPAPLAPALEADYPEIEHITRIYFDSGVLIEHENKKIYEDRVIFADPSFFDVFPFSIVKGDPSRLLDTPQSMVITASMAEKYFGKGDALGKTFQVNKQQSFLVTGVMEDVPVNSHFHFDFVLSFLSKNEQNFGTWLHLWTGVTTLYTYAVLPENMDTDRLQSRIEGTITRYAGERPDVERKIFLQPLRSIYLHSHLEDEIEATNFVSNLVILSTIAFLILIIACINYMNLATAQSSQRAREVGMRKVLGAHRFQLIRQFMGESIILTLVAMCLSVATIEFLLPAFSSLVEKPVDFHYGQNMLFLSGLFFVAFLVGIFSSIYPAVFLSRHQPIKTLKGIKETPKTTFGHVFFKKSLVIMQFVVSVLLIVCTLVINQQLTYMRTANLGFEKEHMITVPIQNDSMRKRYEAIKNELMENPGVTGVTACLRAPISENILVTNGLPEGMPREQAFRVYHNFVDLDYVENFGIEIVAGRAFSRDFLTDREEAFIVNEATVRKSGISSPSEAVNKKFRSGIGIQGTIIGVMKDFHISSFHEEIEPMILSFDPEYFWELSIKIKPDNIPITLASIEKTYGKFLPDYPFYFSFLDKDIDALYSGEEKTGRIVRTFSLIAILIACLGLFGLAAFAAEKRSKEIGIRKVLGATSARIMYLLSTEFTKWVLMANVLAWPIAYLAMTQWLRGFAFRIHIGPWPFLWGAFLSCAIALVTVSYQALKSAVSDPVESLRYE